MRHIVVRVEEEDVALIFHEKRWRTGGIVLVLGNLSCKIFVSSSKSLIS